MSYEPSNQKLEDLVRECVLEKESRRGELNALLRENEEARPIAARVLIEEAVLISELRLTGVKKWAQTLQPRTIEEIAGPTSPRRKEYRMAIALAAAACVGISALIFFNRPATAPRTDVAVNTPKEKWIGTIRQFDQGDGTDAKSSLLGSREFEIGSGRARINLDNGVVLSVTGPARLAVGLRECRLWQGQVGVEVPDDLDHYVVQTDDSRFVDLGTVFTVSTQPGKRSAMAVVKGEVRAERISSEGEVIAEHLVRKAEGAIIEESNAGIEIVKADQLGHEAPIKLADLPLTIPRAYRDAVSAAGPIIVWDFEQQHDPSTFGNSAGPEFSAKIKGEVSVRQVGEENRYLVLGADGNPGWLESPENWRKEDNAPFTVELWARPDRIHFGSLVNFRVSGTIDPVSGRKPIGPLTHFSMEFTHTREQQEFPEEPSLRCSFRSPATEHPTKTTPGGLSAQIFTPQRYEPGEWHHVVARVNQGEFVLIVNGQTVERRTVSLPHLREVNLALRVGALRNGESPRQFNGAIDEVAIYPRALSDGEITDHFRKVREANHWRSR